MGNGWWTDVWSQPRRWVTVSPCFLLPELWSWGNCSKCGRIGRKCSQEWRGDHGFQAWLALIQWVATLHAAGGWSFKAPSSPCCYCDAIQWLEERGFLASFLVSGKEVHGSCVVVYMKQHRYFYFYFYFFLSKQVNYFSHNSSYKFSPNSFWLPIAAIFLSWFLPYSPVFPLPFQIPLTPTTAQLLPIPICFLQRILSSQNFDCFYLRTVFTDLVLS